MADRIKTVRDLKAYQAAFRCAMEIFEITKRFPAEERYSLTDQIRRSSRAVCSNLSESWRKRRYRKVFVNKLSDSMSEAAETQTWLEFCLACGYVDQPVFDRMHDEYEGIIGMLNMMECKADKFCFA
ncbi:MAG: four helix bundle protein [Rhodocyclaceae bacterium]|nr:four helix bundle protein [Rhodocyclaceae bacterium]